MSIELSFGTSEHLGHSQHAGIPFEKFLGDTFGGARGLIVVEALRLCELGFEESPPPFPTSPTQSSLSRPSSCICYHPPPPFLGLLYPSNSSSSLSNAACAVASHKHLLVLPRLLPPLSLQLLFPLKRRLRHHLPARIAVSRVCQKVEAGFSGVLESAHLHMIFLDKSLLYFL